MCDKRMKLPGSFYRQRKEKYKHEDEKQAKRMKNYFSSTVPSDLENQDVDVVGENRTSSTNDGCIRPEEIKYNNEENSGLNKMQVDQVESLVEKTNKVDAENNINEIETPHNEKYKHEIIEITHEEPLISNDPGKWPIHITDCNRQILVSRGPFQVKNMIFPVNDGGRRFTANNYTRRLCNGEEVPRDWLVYSVEKDAIFCFCCRLFSTVKTSLSHDEGFSDWRHMSELLSQHEKSVNHMKAFQTWVELNMRLNSDKTIDSTHQILLKNESHRWKQVLKRIIIAILFLGTQNLAFRGKSDVLYERNNGNFLKLMEFVAQFDVVMADHLRRITSKETHVHYLGKDIQNEIIQLLAEKIKEIILAEVIKWKYYSIILDCTPDISHIEQMSLVLRFVQAESGTAPLIQERFLGFIPVDNTSGEALTEIVIQYLKGLNIPLSDMRGQGYDNGANMRGKHAGVQRRILDLNPRAFFVPCSAHSLNLVLNDAATSCKEAVSFFSVVQEIYNFFSGSNHRWSLLLKHVSSLTVKPLSETRWESRIDAVTPFRYQLGEIYDALYEASEDTRIDAFGRHTATSLLSKLKSYKFICCLTLWHEILCRINIISKSVQNPSLNIEHVLKLIQNIKQFFETMRSDKGFNEMLVDSRELAEAIDVEPLLDSEVKVRPRRVKRLFDYESRDEVIADPTESFKVNVYFYILDKAIVSLRERFELLRDHNDRFGFLYRANEIDKCELRKHCNDLQLSLTDGDHCDIDANELYNELLVLRTINNFDNESGPENMLKYITVNRLIENFPNLSVAFRIILTLPVSVASAERDFSKLKIIKNYLRSTMGQERLVGLSMISINCDILKDMDMDTMRKDFAEKKARKVNML